MKVAMPVKRVKMPKLPVVYLGTPKTMAKGKGVEMPMTKFPKFTELSNQFNDYNKNFKNVRSQPIQSSMQKKSWDYWGNGGHGRYKSYKWNPNGVDGKLQFKHHKKKEYDINNKELEEEKQRTEEGAEVRGYVKLNKKKATRDNKKIMEKTNRGIDNKKGWWAAGNRFKDYEKQAIHSDTNYKKFVEDVGEFQNLNKNKEYKALQGQAKDKYIEPDMFGN